MKLTGLLFLGLSASAAGCVSLEPAPDTCINTVGGFYGFSCNGDNGAPLYPEGGCPPEGATDTGDYFVTILDSQVVCATCDEIEDARTLIKIFCNCGASPDAVDVAAPGLADANENALENANSAAGTGSGANGNGQGQGVNSNNGRGSGSN